MDDARLPGEMTLDDIAKQLETLRSDVRTGFVHVNKQLSDTNNRIHAIQTEMTAGFLDVKERVDALQADLMTGLLDAKERDDANHGDLVARLRDVDTASRIRDERLLKDILRHLAATRPTG